MEELKYIDHDDLINRLEWEDSLLRTPLTKLTLRELRSVKDILTDRLKENKKIDEGVGRLGNLVSDQPRDEKREELMTNLYTGLNMTAKKAEDYPEDLKIVTGLIAKYESEERDDAYLPTPSSDES